MALVGQRAAEIVDPFGPGLGLGMSHQDQAFHGRILLALPGPLEKLIDTFRCRALVMPSLGTIFDPEIK